MSYANVMPEMFAQGEADTPTGCPCGLLGQCCNDPQVFNPDHEHTDSPICQECNRLECANCKNYCYHAI